MNPSYLKAKDKLTFLKMDLEKLFEEGQKEGRSFEDSQAYYILENIIEKIDIAAHKLKRYSFPVIDGKLQEDGARHKFELIRQDNGKSIGYMFSCADYLEVQGDDGEWYPGRVEHTTRDGQTGYYFCCSDLDNPFLYTGMRVRVRKEHIE